MRYLDGDSIKIAKALERKEIPSTTGKEIWSIETINKLLKNEKVYGNVLLYRTFVKDVLEGRCVKNNGELNKGMIRNNHPHIMIEKVFVTINRTRC